MKRLLASRVKNLVYRIIKGKTVGVRALIIKGEKTLLVKHSYRPLWYMPGGGVDAIAGNLDYDSVAPFLAWGPNLWADGLMPRSDGLVLRPLGRLQHNSAALRDLLGCAMGGNPLLKFETIRFVQAYRHGMTWHAVKIARFENISSYL